MLNDTQYAQLLKPLHPSRVAKRQQAGRSLSYLEAWDVKAHLNRIFGFLNWSADVLSADLVFEEKNEKGQWNVGYKVILRLTIGENVFDGASTYTEAAVGSATLPQRGEAHDMAVKTAESDALKRAAINLGTQFGLSLYNDGSLKDVVTQTLDRNVTLHDSEPEPPVTDVAAPALTDSEGAETWIANMKTAIDAKDVDSLMEIKKSMNENKANDLVFQGVTLSKWLDKAMVSAMKGTDK